MKEVNILPFYTDFSLRFEEVIVKEFQLLIFGEDWTKWVGTKEDFRDETDRLLMLAWLWANDYVVNIGYSICEVKDSISDELDFDYECYDGEFDFDDGSALYNLEGHYESYDLVKATKLLKGVVLLKNYKRLEGIIEELDDVQKVNLLKHFNTIYECKQLTINEFNMIHLAWLWDNGFVVEVNNGLPEISHRLNIPFNTYELTFEVEEAGGVNLNVTYEYYELDQIIKIIKKKL